MHCCSLLVPYTAHLSPSYPCAPPWECLSSDPYPTLHTEDLHTLVRVMQCLGSFGRELWARPMSGCRSTCELFVPGGESEPRGGLGCAQGPCPGQILRVPHQGAGQGVSKACLLLYTGLAQRESRLPASSSPDDQYHHFLAVTPLIYTVNKLH